MFESHNKYILFLYDEKCEVIYIDTDSFISSIKCDNVYDIIKCDIIRMIDSI